MVSRALRAWQRGLPLTLLLVWGLGPAAARADEVRVLAAGALKASMERIAPEFARASGHTLRLSYDTVGAQRDRVLAAAPGAAADVVMLSSAALATLSQAGRLPSGPPLALGVVAVALAVPDGAALPDIRTEQTLRLALQATPCLAYADPARGATAGTHFDKVLDQLGLRAALQPRTRVLPVGLDVIEAVAAGQCALGVSQSSEILQHAGVTLVGPLPAPLGLSTPYAAALATDLPAARALLQFMASPSATTALRKSGLLAP